MPLQLMILVIYLLDYLYLIFFVPLYCFYTRLRGFAIIIIIIITQKKGKKSGLATRDCQPLWKIRRISREARAPYLDT